VFDYPEGIAAGIKVLREQLNKNHGLRRDL